MSKKQNSASERNQKSSTVSSAEVIVRRDCPKCEKAKIAIQKFQDVIEAGNMKINELWAQIMIEDAIELFKEVLDEKKSA